MVFSLGVEIDEPVLVGGRVRALARRAQNARLGYVVLRDGPGSHGRIDAVGQAAYAAPLTTSLGLVAEVSTTYNEPFHTAVQLQTVDFASNGRAGWLPSRTAGPEHPTALGRPQVAEADLAVEQRDSVRVARALWDSWEDDAVIRDATTGRFLDRAKVRHIDFAGERFAVKGPSITPRSPQGQIPVFARAGELPEALGLADVVITTDVPPAGAPRATPRMAGALTVLALAYSSEDPPTAWARRIAELADHVDGVLLVLGSWERDLPALGGQVIPKLLEAGVIASPRPGQTLRETLGLARPQARHPRTWSA